jgi:hypothetical protein
MPLPAQTEERFNFAGGLNLASDPIHVADSETTDCLNVDFDVRGAVRKRQGSELKYTTTAGGIDYLLPYRRPATNLNTLLAVRIGFGPLAFDSGFALVQDYLGTGESSGALGMGIQAGGSAFLINGIDNTTRIRNNTIATLGTTAGATGNHPKAKYVTFHKGRLFFGNTGAGADPSRVIFTGSDANPADLEYFKALSFIDFDPNDGDEITAVVAFLDQVNVFKRNKIFALRGNQPDSFVNVVANTSLGCVAPRTALAWDKGVLFLSGRGVFSFDGARAVRVSDKIDPALNQLPPETIATAAAVVHQQRYYLFVNENATVPGNDTVYVFDLSTGVWTKYFGWDVRQAAVWNRIGAEELFGVDESADRRQIRQYKVGDSDGKGSAVTPASWTPDYGPSSSGCKNSDVIATAGGSQHRLGGTVVRTNPPTASPAGTPPIQPSGTYTYWATTAGTWQQLAWTLRVDTSPPPEDGFFWATDFYFTGTSNSAYCGLQGPQGGLPDQPNQKVALFSVFGGVAAVRNPDVLNSVSEAFAEAPGGYRVVIPYPWVQGRTYTLRVTRDSPRGPRWWGAWIRDDESGIETWMGSVQAGTGAEEITGTNVVQFTEYPYTREDLTTCQQLPYGEATFGTVNFSSPGIPIAAHFTTKWFDFGTAERRKMARRLYVYFQAQGRQQVNVDVFKGYQSNGPSQYLVDLDPQGWIWGQAIWGQTRWGSGLDTIQKRLTGLGTHTTFRVKVYDNSTNPWLLEGLAFILIPRQLK